MFLFIFMIMLMLMLVLMSIFRIMLVLVLVLKLIYIYDYAHARLLSVVRTHMDALKTACGAFASARHGARHAKTGPDAVIQFVGMTPLVHGT
jgi:hypothetical protein